MNLNQMKQIFKDTDFVRWSGSTEEAKAADYIKAKCVEMGVSAEIEEFDVSTAEIEEAHLWADGREIPCRALMCCGSGEVEADFYYMPGTDPVSIAGAKGKIVLLDQGGVGHFLYQDLIKAGAKGIIMRYGDVHYNNSDIDERDLRDAVVGEAERALCAIINVKDAVKLVAKGTKRVKLQVKQSEGTCKSRNVVATLPGELDEYVVMSAHYDSTRLSHGSYDNMSGVVGLLGTMDRLKGKKLHYGVKFVFCGSEERGLLGSKAYVAAHEEELPKFTLNVNLDMIGTTMGKFVCRVTGDEKLAHYIEYMGAEVGFPIDSNTGVWSSDSTSFADKGVPALSFARNAGNAVAPIHCRYDRMDVLSMKQMETDIGFISEFVKRMAQAAVCPVSRDIPEKLKTELDEYLARKRKK